MKNLILHLKAHVPLLVTIVIIGGIGTYLEFASHADIINGKIFQQTSIDISSISQTNAQITALDDGVQFNADKSLTATKGAETNVSSNDERTALAVAAADKTVSTSLATISTKRTALLEKLMQTDPDTAAKLLLPDSVLDDLHFVPNNNLEKKVTLSGTYAVLHKDGLKGEDIDDYQVIGKQGIVTHLYTNGSLPNIAPGSHVSVQAYQIQQTALVVADTQDGNTTSKMMQTDDADSTSLGPLNTAVILADFPNSTGTLSTDNNQTIFNGDTGLKNWYNSVSYGKSQLNPTFFGPFTLPDSVSGNNGCPSSDYQTELATAADQAVKDSNADGWSHYQRIVFEFNCYNYQYSGYAYIGQIPFTPPGTASSITVGLSYDFADYTTPAQEEFVFAHELSHNLGNWHASTYNCGPSSFVPTENFDVRYKGCDTTEYGNRFDILGNESNQLAEQDTLHKANAGWLSSSNYPVLSRPGTYTYTLLPYETPTDGVLALNIPRGNSGTSFTLEYRQALAFDSWLADPGACPDCLVTKGPMLNYNYYIGGQGGGGDTQLIDTDASNNGNIDQSALLPGKTFTDPQTGISITTISADTSGATVTVTVPQSNSCVRAAPTVNLASTPSASAAYPQPFSYTYTIHSNDSSTCSPEQYKFTHDIAYGQKGTTNAFGNFSVAADHDSLLLAPGASRNLTVTLVPDKVTTAGTYNFYSLGYFLANDSIIDNNYTDIPVSATVTVPPDKNTPTAPTNLSVQSLGAHIATVSWKASTDNTAVAGYVLTVNDEFSYRTTGTSFTLPYLDAGTKSTIKVVAFDRHGRLSQPASKSVTQPAVTDIQPPTVPGNLTTSVSANSVTLHWDRSADDKAVVGYAVGGFGALKKGAAYSDGANSLLSPTANTTTLRGLSPGTTYTAYIMAIDGDGNTSYTDATNGSISFTTPKTGTVAPAAPQKFHSPSGTAAGIHLSWQPSIPTTNIAGYYVFRALGQHQVLAGKYFYLGTTTDTSYLDVVSPHAAYYAFSYYVQALDTNGNVSAPSNTTDIFVPASDPAHPSAPTQTLITSPADGAKVAGNVKINVTSSVIGSNNGVNYSGVSYYIDNQEVFVQFAAPYSYTWNSKSVSNGLHTIYARSSDTTGNYRTSKIITVTTAN